MASQSMANNDGIHLIPQSFSDNMKDQPMPVSHAAPPSLPHHKSSLATSSQNIPALYDENYNKTYV